MIIIAEKILVQFGKTPKSGWAVHVQKGKICNLGPVNTLCRAYPKEKTLDLKHAVVMPGLVNVHTHLEIPAHFGMQEAHSYSSWVLNLLKAKRILERTDYINAVKDNISSLVRTGTTTVGEICTHGISPRFLMQSGIRACVFNELISMDPSKPLPTQILLSVRDRSLIRFGLSPHSPHTVSEAAFGVIADLMKRRRLRISIHAAETRDEGRLLRRSKSDLARLYDAAGWDLAWAPKASSSIALLDRLGVLCPETMLVHAVDVTENDIDLIKRRGASVAHCPRSNRSLRVGTMPLKYFLDKKIPVGIGTDSLASALTLSLWDEMRFAYSEHKKKGITPQDLLFMATMGGAACLGLGGDIGSLQPGKKADIIAAPLPRRNSGDICSDLLRETETCIMTMVNGRILDHQGP